MPDKYLLEVCTGNLCSVKAAVRAGAQRVELCSALGVDGLTPSVGLIRYVRQKYPDLTLHVLIRPREGNFVYTQDELAVMQADVCAAVEAGADGVVIGCLTAEGNIDTSAVKRLIQAADGRHVTFHRAFDHCKHPEQALEDIIDLGCDRLLTSGQAPQAIEGLTLLRRLVAQSAGRIIIMPGAGVTAENATKILLTTEASEIHASASVQPYPDADYRETSEQKVRDILATIGRL